MKLKHIQDSSFNLSELFSVLGFKVVLQNKGRLVLESPDGQYIIKIFSDVSGEQIKYLKEKLYYEVFSPHEFPRLVYSDDENEIIITENLRVTGLISQFEFLQNTECKEKLTACVNSSAKGLAQIHKQLYEEYFKAFNDMFSKNKKVKTYEEYEFSTIEEQIQTLQSAGYEEIVPSIECFKNSNIEKTMIVLNHGDYIPWNLFVKAKTGELKAVIDSEWMSVAPLSLDFAKAIRGLIDARKNNPILIKNIDSIIETFMESYISSVSEDKGKILDCISYYLGYVFIDSAFIAHTKWESEIWTKWNLQLANYFLHLDELGSDSILEPFLVESNPIDIEWVGNLTPSIGSETTIVLGESLKVYVSVYVKSEKTELTGSNIATQIWSNVGGEWAGSPMEFVGYEGENYRFEGEISPKNPGKYEFTVRISGDAGNTWKWAGQGKYNAKLICEAK